MNQDDCVPTGVFDSWESRIFQLFMTCAQLQETCPKRSWHSRAPHARTFTETLGPVFIFIYYLVNDPSAPRPLCALRRMSFDTHTLGIITRRHRCCGHCTLPCNSSVRVRARRQCLLRTCHGVCLHLPQPFRLFGFLAFRVSPSTQTTLDCGLT